LLDIRMEGKSGFDVAAYLRQSLQMPFMFLSAFSDDATVAQVQALGAVAYLVKPLDIRQIVPAVEAAFANIRAQAPAAAATAPTETTAPALEPTVAMAVGVLMHRYSLARDAALTRLQQMADAEHLSLAGQAERLLEALELLSRPAGL
jgi:response regulator NasT